MILVDFIKQAGGKKSLPACFFVYYPSRIIITIPTNRYKYVFVCLNYLMQQIMTIKKITDNNTGYQNQNRYQSTNYILKSPKYLKYAIDTLLILSELCSREMRLRSQEVKVIYFLSVALLTCQLVSESSSTIIKTI